MAVIIIEPEYPENLRMYAKKTFHAEMVLISIYGSLFKVPKKITESKTLLLEGKYITQPKKHALQPLKSVSAKDKISFMVLPKTRLGKTVDCISTQTFETKWDHNGVSSVMTVKISGKYFGSLRLYAGVLVWIDATISDFVKNEGLVSDIVFAKMYPNNAKMTLVHWTDKKY